MTDGSLEKFGASSAKREEALREYYFVEELIDRYDAKSLTLKSWSVTASGVAIGFGFTEKQTVLFALACAGSLTFWYLEALWKVYQSILAARALELEIGLSASDFEYHGPLICHTFRKAFREKARVRKILPILRNRNVWLPHGLVFLLGLSLSLGSLLRP